jgi:DNA-binding transcriptional LysR family regulator
LNNSDWQQWHFFVVIAEQGSLNRASNELGISQPTLSRQLYALEKSVGNCLFDRSTQGLTLTAFGQALLPQAKRMQENAFALQRMASGQQHSLSGRVRLSVNENIAQYYLAPVIAQFLEKHPQLSVEVDVSNKATNIDKRDTDIAVRMFKPTQLDVVSKHLDDIPVHFYASPEYIKQFGVPATIEELFSHRLIGFDRDRQFEDKAEEYGWSISNEDFKFRTDNIPLQFEVACAGGGIVATHQAMASQYNLVKIDLGIQPQTLSVHLVCHRDLYQNSNIQALYSFLSEHLRFT